MDCEYIEDYFKRGFTTDEILNLLADSRGLSKRTLESILSKKQLSHPKNKTDVAEVATFIEQQLETSGQCHGYRWLHQKCWLHGIVTDSANTAPVIGWWMCWSEVKKHSCGPNYVWHIDGYDKLKPFGIAISGCIDGFSRNHVHF